LISRIVILSISSPIETGTCGCNDCADIDQELTAGNKAARF
jgi:hypothetical protein